MRQTLILSSSAERSVTHAHMVVVATPLDAIVRLEDESSIERVVLSGTYARNDELSRFLAERYPSVQLEHEA